MSYTHFSISQTPVDGYEPTEAQMLQNSCASSSRRCVFTRYGLIAHPFNPDPEEVKATAHWKGEIGLCTDFSTAHHVFA